ncbi:MAG: Snf7 family protein [Candidatus Thermoplasmatota archaeon]|jgi:Asp-tRNA(Asn)/Glu-tRNA(Gln) amidotransferase A subunit family amidase|nr:Snf7 family protein [Candidatus Thermoplasmatota archaeon]MCL5955742.1 Snf7 family protein [Candidatus Thermoplasmatota archaeon]
MAIKLRKSEEEKNFEKRSKISKWKGDIDRAIRQYERNYEKNVQNLKVAIDSENSPKAKLFASNIANLEGAIKGLKDYKLFLENVDLSLQFAKTTKDIWASLKQSAKDLAESQLSESQMSQVQQNIESIVSVSEQIEDRLSGQLEMITRSVDSKGISDKNVEDIIGRFVSNKEKMTNDTESKIDEMISEAKKSLETNEEKSGQKE